MPISLPEYVSRWKASTLTERAAAQSHFIDLCEVLGQVKQKTLGALELIEAYWLELAMVS
jgi:hypothetical protein